MKTINNDLAYTASLTTAIADKDKVIGDLINNLNGVLDTVNARGAQLSDLIVTLQQLVTGLSQDRKPIGDAIDALGGLATTTSGLLEEARGPLKQDIANLGVLTDRLNAHEKEVEHFIQFLPVKAATLTRTVSYGSWFNFFLCSAEGSVVIPGLITQPINIPVTKANLARCS